jgi:hypothetical protein
LVSAGFLLFGSGVLKFFENFFVRVGELAPTFD